MKCIGWEGSVCRGKREARPQSERCLSCKIQHDRHMQRVRRAKVEPKADHYHIGMPSVTDSVEFARQVNAETRGIVGALRVIDVMLKVA